MTGSIFIPEADQIHESWFSQWGRHIGSERLGEELFRNDRLKQRAYEHMILASGLDLEFKYPDDEWITLNTYATQRDKLMRLCGMVIHGHLLRAYIVREEFELLAKSVSVDELRLAMNLRDFHVEHDDRAVDLQRVSQLIERSGATCLSLWRESLPLQSRLRLELLDDFDSEAGTPKGEIGPELAGQIVTEVCRILHSNKAWLTA